MTAMKRIYDIKIYDSGRHGREMETIRGIDDPTIVESLRMVFTRLGVRFTVKEYSTQPERTTKVMLHIKCKCEYDGWVEQEGDEDQGGTNLCPQCSSDEWEYLEDKIISL
jgi:hypothetical protein